MCCQKSLDRMINVGMIGAGYIAEWVHCPALVKLRERSGNLCLKAISNRTESKAIQLKEKFGFEKVYTNYQEMLDKEELDCVYVLTAVDVIKKHAVAVMSKGIPLFMEKPPGRNSQETEELIACAKKYRSLTFVAFNRRFDPLLRKGKELFTQRNEISHISVDFYRWNRTEAYFWTTAIHGIDTIRFLAGDIKEVAVERRKFSQGGSYAYLLFMKLRKGATAFMQIFPEAGIAIERYTLQGNGETMFINRSSGIDYPGSIRYYTDSTTCTMVDNASLPASQREDFILEGFYGETEYFINQVREGKKMSPDLKKSLQSMLIAEAMHKGACLKF